MDNSQNLIVFQIDPNIRTEVSPPTVRESPCPLCTRRHAVEYPPGARQSLVVVVPQQNAPGADLALAPIGVSFRPTISHTAVWNFLRFLRLWSAFYLRRGADLPQVGRARLVADFNLPARVGQLFGVSL